MKTSQMKGEIVQVKTHIATNMPWLKTTPLSSIFKKET
jgi:hypothetical protein